MGLKDEHMSIEDEALASLIQGYCRENGVRNLQKHVEKICRKVALKVVRATQPQALPSTSEGEAAAEVTTSTAEAVESDPLGIDAALREALPDIAKPAVVDGVHVPLLPRDAWSDQTAYDATRLKLADMFINNFKKFSDGEASSLADYGPQLHVK